MKKLLLLLLLVVFLPGCAFIYVDAVPQQQQKIFTPKNKTYKIIYPQDAKSLFSYHAG